MAAQAVVHPDGECGIRLLHGGCPASLCRPYDPTRPVVCFDELPYQLVDDSRPRCHANRGCRCATITNTCAGACNLFGCFEPLVGRRQITVTAQRTKRDFAEAMRMLVDGWYPEADGDSGRAGQPEHAYGRGALRSVRARRGAADPGTNGVALHAEAWQLAQSDGDW